MRLAIFLLIVSVFTTVGEAQPVPSERMRDLLARGVSATQLIQNVDRSLTVLNPMIWFHGKPHELSPESDPVIACNAILNFPIRQGLISSLAIEKGNSLVLVSQKGFQSLPGGLQQVTTGVSRLTCKE